MAIPMSTAKDGKVGRRAHFYMIRGTGKFDKHETAA